MNQLPTPSKPQTYEKYTDEEGILHYTQTIGEKQYDISITKDNIIIFGGFNVSTQEVYMISFLLESVYGIRKDERKYYYTNKDDGIYKRLDKDELKEWLMVQIYQRRFNDSNDSHPYLKLIKKSDKIDTLIEYVTKKVKTEHKVIQFNNGYYDQETLEKVQMKPETIYRNTVNADYEAYTEEDVKEKETKWVKEYKKSYGELWPFYCMIKGYAFLGEQKYDRMLAIVGSEGAGKGINSLINKAVIGDEFLNIASDGFEDRDTRADIIQKRIVVISDFTAIKDKNLSKLKLYTSINDTIKERRNYKSMEDEMEVTIKPFIELTANNLQATFDTALKNRMWIVNVNQEFRGTTKEIQGLGQKICDKSEEIEYFVNTCIYYYKNGINCKWIGQNTTHTNIDQIYKKMNINYDTYSGNPLNQYIQENILWIGYNPEQFQDAKYLQDKEIQYNHELQNITESITRDQLHEKFTEWLTQKGLKKDIKQRDYITALKHYTGIKDYAGYTINRKTHYKGLKIITNEET